MVTRKSIGIASRRNADGSMSYTAQLLVKPFPRTSQTFPTMAEAVAWRRQMREELLTQRKDKAVRPDLPTLSLASLNGEYLKDPEALALADYKDRQRHLNWWTLKFGTVKVLDFGVIEGRAARELLMVGRSPATVDRYLAAERAAWNWGRASGLVPKDRAWPPRLMLTEPDARTRFLSDDELAAVLTQAKAHSPVMLAAVTVALATGVRQGEMLRLTWADVDFARSTIRLLLTKNGTARSVHLPAIAVEALRAVKADTVVSTTHVFLYRDGTPMTGDGCTTNGATCAPPRGSSIFAGMTSGIAAQASWRSTARRCSRSAQCSATSVHRRRSNMRTWSPAPP